MPKLLTDVPKAKQMGYLELLTHYCKDSGQLLDGIVMGDETWVSYTRPERKCPVNGMVVLKLTTKTKERKTKFEHQERDTNSFLGSKGLDSRAVYAKMK